MIILLVYCRFSFNWNYVKKYNSEIILREQEQKKRPWLSNVTLFCKRDS